MRALAGMRELEVWYAHTVIDEELEASVDPKFAQAIRRTASRAHSRDNLQALGKLTRVVDGRRQLASDPPLLIPIDELVGQQNAHRHEQHMNALIDTYRNSIDISRRLLIERFRYAGMARKVVGIGSVGTRAWVVMLLGRDENDPLLMQVKEADRSVLESFLAPSDYTNAAQRVVAGQRLMQATGDILLGWLRCVGPDGREGDYYVRQLHDWKGAATVESITVRLLTDYGRSCAHVLARAHARTGDRIAIAGYLGDSDARHRTQPIRPGLCGAERTRLSRPARGGRQRSGARRTGPLGPPHQRPRVHGSQPRASTPAPSHRHVGGAHRSWIDRKLPGGQSAAITGAVSCVGECAVTLVTTHCRATCSGHP